MEQAIAILKTLMDQHGLGVAEFYPALMCKTKK
jgi:antitoxin component HigA of HigAB toxin-antitoxin module